MSMPVIRRLQQGTVEVRGGQIHVDCPPGAVPPVIRVPGDLTVRVNGQPAHGLVTLRPGDRLEVDLPVQERAAYVEVEVSSDQMACHVAVWPRVRRVLRLADSPPAPLWDPAVVVIEERVAELRPADVLAAMAEKGVVFGIDAEAVAEAAAAADGRARPAARGAPPAEGHDGWVECLFPNQPRLISPENDNESVDYRERYEFPSVKEGELLAILHDPEPGLPGRDVRGQPVAPPGVRPAALVTGPGALLAVGGRKVYAARSGRPIARERLRTTEISVLPVLERRGHVDLSCGNLRFDGDVVIWGNVERGMQVVSEGALAVNGNADGASVYGRQGVFIAGKAIGSQVAAGEPLPEPLPPHVAALVAELAADLDRLMAACTQVQTRYGEIFRHPGQVMQALTDAKYPSIRERLRLLETLQSAPQPLSNWLNEARAGILEGRCESVEALAGMRERLARIQGAPDPSAPGAAPIRLGYAQNSRLESSGDVDVQGDGCLYTTIRAGGSVRIRSAFRGGAIRAGGDIFVGRAGSAGGHCCEFTVPESATVTFRQAMPGVRVQVGPASLRFEESRSAVRVRCENGRAIIESAAGYGLPGFTPL